MGDGKADNLKEMKYGSITVRTSSSPDVEEENQRKRYHFHLHYFPLPYNRQEQCYQIFDLHLSQDSKTLLKHHTLTQYRTQNQIRSLEGAPVQGPFGSDLESRFQNQNRMLRRTPLSSLFPPEFLVIEKKRRCSEVVQV